MNNQVHVGDIITLGDRRVRVSGIPGDPAGRDVCRDSQGRVAVRNVDTDRLSYIPEYRLLKAVWKRERETRHTCVTDDGGTPNRQCHACKAERASGGPITGEASNALSECGCGRCKEALSLIWARDLVETLEQDKSVLLAQRDRLESVVIPHAAATERARLRRLVETLTVYPRVSKDDGIVRDYVSRDAVFDLLKER